MEQSPCRQVNTHSATREIFCPLWDPKVYYRVHNSPPLIPVLIHTNPAHIFLSYFHMIHSSIILPSMPWSFQWCLSLF